MRGVRALVGPLLVLALAACAPTAAPARISAPAQRASASPPPTTAVPSTTPPAVRPAHSLDDPRSLWVVVNRRRPLQPRSFVPPDLVAVAVPHTNAPLLRRPAAAATVALVAAARRAGLRLLSISAYRSYSAQQRVYGEDLRRYGRATADRQTARPGSSEHQTGLAIDLGAGSGRCSLAACFGRIPEGRWVAANGWRFGFVLRYPEGADRTTGYEYEPWHLRYVGRALAAAVHRAHDEPLERWFGLPDAPEHR